MAIVLPFTVMGINQTQRGRWWIFNLHIDGETTIMNVRRCLSQK